MSSPPPSSTIPPPQTLPITTHHCRFCTTLLLATTRDLASLSSRNKPGSDSARILPLRNIPLPAPSTDETEPETDLIQTHYTILLSTLSRDTKPKIIARSDGFEKRFFTRCGRCRVVVGYFLDEVHFPSEGGLLRRQEEVEVGVRDEGVDEVGEGGRGDRVVYLLPGALMETEIMDDEEKMRKVDAEWRLWFKG
ncbi:hypothetical protein BJY04DRAFT_222838 [Aspergillus karnatakaensis]|uniref:uncharacterized protein n=1 Tax=Aspergillus karnatakaensis TaxID=1810916 RepID=UPI003CCCA489